MGTIGIAGSGNVGANTAFFLAERGVADIVLFDVQDGISEGKALDMMEAASIRDYQTSISGTNEIKDLLKTDVIIIAAGTARTPGQKRDDLLDDNLPVMEGIAGTLKGFKGIVIVVTEPVDILTTVFIKKSGMAPARVLGLGGFLDSERLRFLIARELSISYENVSAMVIGRHSDDMIPLPDYCRVSGIPVTTLVSGDRFAAIVEETRKSGDVLVELAQRGSAYYGPAAVASDLAEAIVRNTRRVISVSQMWTGQYGIDGVAMSLPSVIGKNGIEKTLEPVLDEEKKRSLAESAEAIRSRL
jgi:malate dehydrogenase